MPMEMQKPNEAKGAATHASLRIAEIRDNTVIMQDGTLRAILAVSSTNFDLKSEEEQNGIVYGYQRFLNSLDFPVQILMQSRRLDIADYVGRLKVTTSRLTNELLKMQANYYTQYITELVTEANVMSKNFYIVVPLSQSVLPASGGFFSNLFGGGASRRASEKLENMERLGEQLQQRVDAISSNLGGLGLRIVRLDTGALIELYYNSYNFESAPALDSASLGDIKIFDAGKMS
jgi:type IV secretory pathway VirB4 component